MLHMMVCPLEMADQVDECSPCERLGLNRGSINDGINVDRLGADSADQAPASAASARTVLSASRRYGLATKASAEAAPCIRPKLE
jgi:hypothetical protein